jgi:SEL1 protein
VSIRTLESIPLTSGTDTAFLQLAPKQEWSLREWINNFVQDDVEYYDEVDAFDDLYDENGMPGGDPLDFDDGVMESVVILGLAAALAFLVMYRQHRQQAARRREEETRRQQQQQQQQPPPQQAGVPGRAAAENQQQPEQQDRGLFPQPGDPDFGQWAVGGVGH